MEDFTPVLADPISLPTQIDQLIFCCSPLCLCRLSLATSCSFLPLLYRCWVAKREQLVNMFVCARKNEDCSVGCKVSLESCSCLVDKLIDGLATYVVHCFFFKGGQINSGSPFLFRDFPGTIHHLSSLEFIQTCLISTVIHPSTAPAWMSQEVGKWVV